MTCADSESPVADESGSDTGEGEEALGLAFVAADSQPLDLRTVTLCRPPEHGEQTNETGRHPDRHDVVAGRRHRPAGRSVGA